MKPRVFDPLRLDVEAFAKERAECEGEWTLASLDRLTEAVHPDAKPTEQAVVSWRIRGESRAVKGGPPQTWLHLRAHTRMALVCQRCLGPVDTDIEVDRSLLFVAGEDKAAELDSDSEDDVLALNRALDVRALAEDELLLALPLVPRHEVCPEPLPMGEGPDDSFAEPAHPFAALSVLKRGQAQ